MRVIDVKKVKISEKTLCVYSLILENNAYTVECKEQDKSGRVKDSASVKDITTEQEVAKEIFQKVARNGVCACTLFDVVSDLIC